MTYKSSVDIVLPVLNEQDVLNISVSRLLKFCSEGMVSYNWKIIIADNGSTDETYNIAKQIESDSKNVNVIKLPKKGSVFVSIKDSDKTQSAIEMAKIIS